MVAIVSAGVLDTPAYVFVGAACLPVFRSNLPDDATSMACLPRRSHPFFVRCTRLTQHTPVAVSIDRSIDRSIARPPAHPPTRPPARPPAHSSGGPRLHLRVRGVGLGVQGGHGGRVQGGDGLRAEVREREQAGQRGVPRPRRELPPAGTPRGWRRRASSFCCCCCCCCWWWWWWWWWDQDDERGYSEYLDRPEICGI